MTKFFDYIWSSWATWIAFHVIVGVLVVATLIIITVIYGYGTRPTEIAAAVLVPSYLLLVALQYIGKKRSK